MMMTLATGWKLLHPPNSLLNIFYVEAKTQQNDKTNTNFFHSFDYFLAITNSIPVNREKNKTKKTRKHTHIGAAKSFFRSTTVIIIIIIISTTHVPIGSTTQVGLHTPDNSEGLAL
jgi:hypothetical protein